MKIGIDARMFRSSTGGIGVYSQNLIRNLAKIDRSNQYYIFLGKEDLAEYDIKNSNFHPIKVNIPHYWLREQFVFPGILKKYDFDLVHFLNFNHPIFYPGKFIATIHDLTMIKSPSGRNQLSIFKRIFYKLVLADAIKKSQLIDTISNQTKKDINSYYQIDKNKIEVIPLSIDKKRFQPVNPQKGRAVLEKYKIDSPYLLFVSQLRPHKGINYLLEAFRLLKKEYHQDNLKLVLVGKDFGDFPQLSRKIQKEKKKGDLIVPGFVENKDMASLYSLAQCFVFPSLFEGFGLPPLEAMACGTPVAASNMSCIPEILGDAPIYFDPKDPAIMASKINTVLINQKLADKLVERGNEQIKKYSWQKTAQGTFRLYQKIVNNK